jgi:hypothetical protein
MVRKNTRNERLRNFIEKHLITLFLTDDEEAEEPALRHFQFRNVMNEAVALAGS